ncbi:TIGR02611 family protein [Actinocorallia sp. API 0066]|uniref:PGPGW domain-containing protein n=1 Tax=Actinocorallia sp. API 0066 TaxID=2896846 RepID=UPI001E467A67|nr:PGPGW domain-containing protein [Actinocorallia sp. API 0066]MCD0448851.1 TIGR02611 family protein [Actinocorallia sp. API 0066]
MAIDQEKDLQGSGGRLDRIRAVMRSNPLLYTTWRIGVFTVGATVLVAGVLMMVLPGPGILAIVVGFAILATEFVWAQRALGKAKAAAERAKEKALDPRTRRRNLALAILAGLLVAAALVAYLYVVGPELPWRADWSRINTT